MHSSKSMQQVRSEAVSEFLGDCGPVVSGAALWKTLGYASAEAFRQARHRGSVKLHLVEMPGRRGVFAFRHELIQYVANLEVRPSDEGLSQETE